MGEPNNSRLSKPQWLTGIFSFPKSLPFVLPPAEAVPLYFAFLLSGSPSSSSELHSENVIFLCLLLHNGSFQNPAWPTRVMHEVNNGLWETKFVCICVCVCLLFNSTLIYSLLLKPLHQQLYTSTHEHAFNISSTNTNMPYIPIPWLDFNPDGSLFAKQTVTYAFWLMSVFVSKWIKSLCRVPEQQEGLVI